MQKIIRRNIFQKNLRRLIPIFNSIGMMMSGANSYREENQTAGTVNPQPHRNYVEHGGATGHAHPNREHQAYGIVPTIMSPEKPLTKEYREESGKANVIHLFPLTVPFNSFLLAVLGTIR